MDQVLPENMMERKTNISFSNDVSVLLKKNKTETQEVVP